MKNIITVLGKIGFEPENKTKKHTSQSSWKRMAMVNIDGDASEYYSWFVKKRYNLELNRPLRGSHISFINDSIKDLSCNGTKTIEQIDATWNVVKAKWDKKVIPVTLDISPKSDSKHWWLRVPEEEREILQTIRTELGLGRPYWGMHMTIGYASSVRMQEHSKYICRLINNGFIPS